MKIKYLIPPLVFALGLALFILGTMSTESALFGLPIHPRAAKGLGIIIMVFSTITLAAVAGGGSQPPDRTGRRE